MKRTFYWDISFWLWALLLVFLGLQSCVPTRHVPHGKHLLVKNHITIEKGQDAQIDVSDIEPILKQKPNRRILGLFRFHLGVFNFANKKKGEVGKIRTWMKETIGEPPVILDEELTEKSRKQLQQFARNKGYYNAVVTDSTHYKKKKAKVYYHLVPNQPYTIKKITFSISDTALIKPIRSATKGTLMKPGANFDVYMITNERNRMEKAMQNQGYYTFLKEYVYFEADTTIEENKVNVKLVIKNPSETIELKNGEDSIVEKMHKVYYINNVYVNSLYNPSNPFSYMEDTLKLNHYIFAHASKMQFRPEVLAKNIFIKKGQKYAVRNSEYTYDRLAGMKTFKFINITYEEAEPKNGKKQLDCYIDLSPVPRQSFTTELTGTHRGGNLGVATGLSYKNKNSFKGAEILQVRMNAGLEATQVISETEDDEISELVKVPFNTLDLGPEVSLFFPKLFFPKKINKLPRYQNPTTDLTFRYSYQVRAEFRRTLTSGTFSYGFKTSKHSNWIISPLDVNLLNISFTDSIFRNELLSTGNSFLINSYKDHLLIGSRVSYIFTNQNINKPTNFIYFRTNLEGVGNALRATAPLLGLNQNADDSYLLFGVPFAQYVKTEMDIRFYRRINENSNAVYRIFAGVGIPFKNLNVLPFEKSFFAGGSNGIRAWQSRELGPGSVSDTVITSGIDQIGDIRLEANAEYRFDITEILEGALFLDAGNIWLMQEDPQREDGQFQFDRFYNQIAFGTGFGMRFDFNFFILRLDLGLPIKDPGLARGERWITQPKLSYNSYQLAQERDKLSALETQLSNAQTQEAVKQIQSKIDTQEKYISDKGYRYSPKVVFNLGIGYPF